MHHWVSLPTLINKFWDIAVSSTGGEGGGGYKSTGVKWGNGKGYWYCRIQQILTELLGDCLTITD